MDRLYKTACGLLFFLVCLISISSLLILLKATGKELFWDANAASWAQALLTTAGIGFALYTAHGAQRHTENLKREELKQKREGVIPIAEAAFDQIRVVDFAAADWSLPAFFDEIYHPGHFSHALTALQSIPLHELSSYSMAVGLIDLTNMLRRVETFCENHSNGQVPEDTLTEAFMSKNVETIVDALRAMKYIRGGAKGLSIEQIDGP